MWRLVFPVLALLLLGASFFRAGSEAMLIAVLLLAAVLAVPRRWAAQLVQLGLLGGAGYWVIRAWEIGAQRAAAGAPWARMALILGAVAAFTLVAALVFRSERLRRFYRPQPSAAG
ncbi:hypothetical protein [Thioalkalivibrio sp. XN8]|uniref:hypothetical protein n=1 Tax=Thioalkalivibrio sp. XN8 TaxID=2712863 RepID=UPI0013EE1DCD|nr:hypothetical protein [Thioalkalivibrio sp. XN8]NGP54249.1 hypothetical protein [Thioalkalivibrio sp. XN8]